MIRKTLFALTLALAAGFAQAATLRMEVNGLVCAFCAQGISKELRTNPATADVLVSLEHRLVAVALKPGQDIADDELRKSLTDAGYTLVSVKRTDESLDAIRAELKTRE
jgi:mercuric ion binding protein